MQNLSLFYLDENISPTVLIGLFAVEKVRFATILWSFVELAFEFFFVVL